MRTFTDRPETDISNSQIQLVIKEFTNVYLDNWIKYSAITTLILVGIYAVGLLSDSTFPVMVTGTVLTACSIIIHVHLSHQVQLAVKEVKETENRLANEASSSRILSGIRTLKSNTGFSSDARLATAVRMATEYPAAIVFNLRDGHGVLAPSNWSYNGQLSHIRDEFEPVEGNDPGAIAARQGSAIVISNTDSKAETLPVWAENAGFSQGIVAPINRGLDTTGVVYVLNKSANLPTLNEIEQLELIINFSSQSAFVSDHEIAINQRKSVRIKETPTTSGSDESPAVTRTIQMDGLALNPESERMEIDGTLISLSPTEFLLMHALASSPKKPVSPEVLMSKCWSKNFRPADNAVDVAIFRLRKKLNKTPSGKELIKTVRGSGYMFIPPISVATLPAVAD